MQKIAAPSENSNSDKKCYQSPVLTELGQVRELTAGGSGDTVEGSGDNSLFRRAN